MYTAKWIVKNKRLDVIFTSLSNFWNHQSGNKDHAIAEHALLNKRFQLDKGGFLAKDGMSVIHWIIFKDELDYKQWDVSRKNLPPIDEDLEWTKIEEIDYEKYIPYRDGKPFKV